MTYFLGVDAGGTHTIAVIVDRFGHVLGRGISGNGNHQINVAQARESIHQAVHRAITEAGVERNLITESFFGMAGADRPVDFTILKPIIDQLSLPSYEIACDTYIALRAGTDQSYGVVIICGTGVNCAGISPANTVYQCGGFNYLHGDFGGGSGLANEVYRAVIRSWDGRGEETLLTPLILDYLAYETVEEMFHDFLNKGKSVPADLAKILFDAAEQGDRLALNLLALQGKELGLSARAVIERLGLEEETFDIVLAGSILTKGKHPMIHEQIERVTEVIAPNSQLVTLEREPVVGALLLAMERASHPISDAVVRELNTISYTREWTYD